MKIYLDDVRIPDSSYTLVHSVNECIRLIEDCEIKNISIELLDLDHDLGDFAKDGGDAICLIDYLRATDRCYPIKIHSANPVGRMNIVRAVNRFYPKDMQLEP